MFLHKLEALINSDLSQPGSVTDDQNSVTDDLMRENPEELFDVSGDLLKSSPENILSSPEDFSDAFDMSPNSLVHDPAYSLNMRQENGAATSCASVRSESISTMSDTSVDKQMLAQFQRQQSAGSSSSSSRPDGECVCFFYTCGFICSYTVIRGSVAPPTTTLDLL